jgi:hypothetical protein
MRFRQAAWSIKEAIDQTQRRIVARSGLLDASEGGLD